MGVSLEEGKVPLEGGQPSEEWPSGGSGGSATKGQSNLHLRVTCFHSMFQSFEREALKHIPFRKFACFFEGKATVAYLAGVANLCIYFMSRILWFRFENRNVYASIACEAPHLLSSYESKVSNSLCSGQHSHAIQFHSTTLQSTLLLSTVLYSTPGRSTPLPLLHAVKTLRSK